MLPILDAIIEGVLQLIQQNKIPITQFEGTRDTTTGSAMDLDDVWVVKRRQHDCFMN